MRDLEVVKKNRNVLSYSISEIREEVSTIKKGRDFSLLTKDEKWVVGQLLGLMYRYIDQKKALDFVLNEDSKLDDYRLNRNYEGIEDKFFADVNVG